MKRTKSALLTGTQWVMPVYSESKETEPVRRKIAGKGKN